MPLQDAAMLVPCPSAVSIDPVSGRPRLAMARLPTPFEPAPRLAKHLGVASVHIKREDMAGYALGGNKLRQLDFILAEAIAAGADMLIATAGSQSNFCRSLAGAAAKLGLGCHLHVRAKMGTELVGNLLLDDIFGAEVTFTQETDPWHPAIKDEIEAIADRYRKQDRSPFVVQLTGVSANVGVAGWMSGAAELREDFKAIGRIPDSVVAVCGSGLTAAGLALGFKHLGVPTRVMGVSAQQPEARLRKWIVETANIAAAWMGIETRLSGQDFDIVDGEIGPGYGIPSDASVAAVRTAGRLEGLVLDPVYTGKGMAALIGAAEKGLLGKASSIAFLHSGGTPGLFTHASAFERAAHQ
ncbi:D-cysteine desulfhydrase/L-cysteate sulfo-lyase [Bosea robiniae]|uniref:D-cysteine desulfhydrase/L-cysteate sulfo-lyase n=2 Tax=Bosea robiniae TaxID=1036780 RepID=A0ABY0NVP2_9HYPH|nr:D-cysteine desulfhydrase/L-cysteate sulfo-lyase [Bosea robiniae]